MHCNKLRENEQVTTRTAASSSVLQTLSCSKPPNIAEVTDQILNLLFFRGMQLTLVTFVFCIVLLTLAKHTSYFTSCISRCKPLTLEEDTLILP